jgi:hypothetical protein
MWATRRLWPSIGCDKTIYEVTNRLSIGVRFLLLLAGGTPLISHKCGCPIHSQFHREWVGYHDPRPSVFTSPQTYLGTGGGGPDLTNLK